MSFFGGIELHDGDVGIVDEDAVNDRFAEFCSSSGLELVQLQTEGFNLDPVGGFLAGGIGIEDDVASLGFESVFTEVVGDAF